MRMFLYFFFIHPGIRYGPSFVHGLSLSFFCFLPQGACCGTDSCGITNGLQPQTAICPAISQSSSRSQGCPVLTCWSLRPVYLIGLPVFLLIVGKRKENRMEPRPLTKKKFLLLIPACFFVMYAGNILGTLLQGWYGFLIPSPLMLWRLGDAGSPGSFVVQMLLLAFVSPVMEEFVFRRCMIDRLRPFGEKAALITSAMMFALFHGSVNQVVYAFGLGLVFGYVYLKTGRLRYTMILHVIINTLTTVILPLLLAWAARAADGTNLNQVQLAEVIQNPGVLILILYIFLLFILFLFGAVVFFFGVREREVSPNGIRMKTVFTSWGILLFLAASLTALI